MADVEISYKGSTIASMSASGTKTLLTEGKYCEDDITVEYTSPGGGGSLVITDEANATGTTAVITVGGGGGGTWETVYEGTQSANADSPYNYFWLSSLSDVYPAANEVYRITADNSEYVITAASAVTSAMGTVVCVGNPKYSGGTDDGSSAPFNFANAGWGAWTGDTELSAGTHSLKIERQVTA